MDERSKLAAQGSARAVSVSVSLHDPRSVADVASAIQSAAQQRRDSVRVSIRGSSPSTFVELLNHLKDRQVEVSAIITLRGDTPAKR